MPTINKRVSLGANEQANPLSGSQYEFLPFNALVEAAILANTGGEVEAYMSSGTDILLENAQVDELAVASPVQYPEHFTIQDVAAAGERIGLSVREIGGNVGPTIVRVSVRITPL